MDSFFVCSVFFVQEFILEPAASNFWACDFSKGSWLWKSTQGVEPGVEIKKSEEADKVVPKINSGATDGGILYR